MTETVVAPPGLAVVHAPAVARPGPSTVPMMRIAAVSGQRGRPRAAFAINELTWFALLLSGDTARAFYRRTKFWLDRIMGGALALLGLRLALSAR